MKMNFEYCQIQKWMLQMFRVEASDEKNGVICLVSMFPKFSKKAHFLQFCADHSKKSKSKSIYLYASERSCYGLSDFFLIVIHSI